MAGYAWRATRRVDVAALKEWTRRNERAREAYDRHPDSTHRQASRVPDSRRNPA